MPLPRPSLAPVTARAQGRRGGALVRLFAHDQAPFWAVAGLMLLAWLFIRPWGDFSLNDDWIYTHFAKRFAETGTVKLDSPSSPNAVGQALLGGLVIRLFGFSHTALRLLTMALGVAGVWAMHRLLRPVVPQRGLRFGALLLVGFNPIYFYSATSFMTELHGWVPAMLGAALWFWGRERAQPGGALVPFWVAALTGLGIGLVFWTRQFCVLVYPALLGATVGRALLAGERSRVVKSLPGLLVGSSLFALAVGSYVPWAKATGNFRPEFAERIDHIASLLPANYHRQGGALVLYMTLYFLPLLLLVPWRRRGAWKVALGAALIALLTLTARARFQSTAPADFWVGPIWTHRVFPWIVNVVWNAGIGPITLDDGFFYDAAHPQWARSVWVGIELVLVAAALLWSPFAARLGTMLRTLRQHAWLEVPLFGALLAAGCTVAIVQVHQMEMVDRYHLPVILGLALLVPAVFARSQSPEQPVRWAAARFALAVVPLLVFVVLGTHDQFRWNEARWQLYERALAAGGTRVTIQGGYEMNCFWRAEGLRPQEVTCGAACGCAYNGFCCVDDEWRLGMSVFKGYEQVEAVQPTYLLAPGPPVILSRRPR